MLIQPKITTIWQLNMHKSKAARDALVKHARNQKTLPIILLTEPYCQNGRVKFDTEKYKIYSRVSKNQRPRAAIAVPHSITAYDFRELSNSDTACIKLEDSLTKKSMLLVSAYLDANITDPNKIVGPIVQEIANITDAQKWGLLIGSDSNAHSFLWGSKDQNTRGDQVEDFLSANNLTVKNTGNTPTWDPGWGPNSVIDITITNRLLEDRVSDWSVRTDYHSQSDHKLICYQIDYISNEQTITTRNYERANWDIFGRSLTHQTKTYNPNRRWGSKNLEQAALELDRAINKAVDKACPEIKITIGKHTPKDPDWYQPETKKLSMLVKKCQKAYNSSPSLETRASWQEARRSLKANIKTNKQTCKHEMYSNIKDIKSFSKMTKSRIGSQPPPIGMLKNPSTGTTTISADEVADVLLDKHLPDSSTTLNQETVIPPKTLDLDHQSLSFINITKLTEAIRLFGPNKTPGPDKLKPIVLQHLPISTLQNLCTLYKVSIALGHVPKSWVKSKVIFLAKPGKEDYTDPNAFRPISLCSFLLKGLERLILFHLEDSCLIKKPLSQAQHAFRKTKGTETALSEAADKIEAGMLRKEYTLGVFLDIAGAFNNLSFESAIKSMRERKFPSKIVDWYKNFLYNQESTYELNNKLYTRALKKGCPQGGVLSPLVWNINFDPILEELNVGPVKVIGFADDACLLITGRDHTRLVDLIQPYLDRIVGWGAQAGLKFNENKTIAVMFTHKLTPRWQYKKIKVNGQEIPYSQEAKYLGIILDSKLTFRKHLSAKLTKAKRLLFAIKGCISKQSGPSLGLTRMAYRVLVIPVLTYGCHIFANRLGTDAIQSELQQLNRLAALSLGSVPRSSPKITLEVLYNLKPLELVMEEIALNTNSRITKDPNRVKLWDGIGANSRDGHLRYWQSKLEQYKIATPVDRDKITNTKVWKNNFLVPSFETTRNNAQDNYNQFVCYTDGSKIKNQTGYGYIIRKYNRTIYDGHGNMGPVASVFQAEIKAITMVCKTLHQRKNMDITIRTDSQAAITAIKAINITSFTVLECKKWLNKLGDKNRVTLAWIQAHVGHSGNDQADALAKAGTALADRGVRHHEPASHFNRLLLEKNIEQWQKKWVAKPDVCKHSKKFIQNVSHCMTKFNKILKNNSDRELVGILIQCITGHCGLRYQAKKSNPLINPVCRYCWDEDETPIHLITTCEALTEPRLAVFDAETLDDNFDWSPEQLLEFIKKTGVWNRMVRQPNGSYL